MWLAATLIVIVFVLGMLARRALSGDGRTDLRRCPRCWYDMAAVAGMRCPECGTLSAAESALFEPMVNRVRARGMLAVTAVFIAGTVWTLWPVHWTQKVPRQVLLAMLWAAVPEVPAQSPGGLPGTTQALRDSRDPWERMVWRYQNRRAFEAWEARVLASTGPITDAELAVLVPLTDHAREAWLFSRRDDESWMNASTKARIARKRAAAIVAVPNDPNLILRLEWTMAELQFAGGGNSHRDDWVQVPDELIKRALAHPDPAVRSWGVSTYQLLAFLRVMERTRTIPDLRDVVESIAAGDPDPDVRKQADRAIEYIDRFKADR